MEALVEMDQFSRTRLQLGEINTRRLINSKVAIFGIGGVGGYCAEALARTGVGAIDLFDSDKISVTNLNRQIIATWKTIGQYKADAMRERILEINPNAKVGVYKIFYLPETADEIDLNGYSYIIDAIDTIQAKIELTLRASACGVPIISSMGAGNKLDPTAFEVADIYGTSVCPMARVMRKELRKRGVAALKVVYSKEPPVKPMGDISENDSEDVICPPGAGLNARRGRPPASNGFVPAAAGLVLAGEVIKDLII